MSRLEHLVVGDNLLSRSRDRQLETFLILPPQLDPDQRGERGRQSYRGIYRRLGQAH